MSWDVSYGIVRRLQNTSVEDARTRITEALEAEGFGVLTEIDVQATLKAKLGVDVPPYLILGACNPALAQRALAAEPAVGLLLPCNVVVTQDDGDALIAAASPRALFELARGEAAVDTLAAEAETRIRRAVDAA